MSPRFYPTHRRTAIKIGDKYFALLSFLNSSKAILKKSLPATVTGYRSCLKVSFFFFSVIFPFFKERVVSEAAVTALSFHSHL